MRFWAKWSLGLAASLFLFVLFCTPWPNGNTKEAAKGTACLSNLKQQATALLIYADDGDARLPLRDRWMNVSDFYRNPGILHCPVLPEGAYGYAFNAELSGAAVPKRAEGVPLVYESVELRRNVSDRFASLPRPGRHKERSNVAYADGHVKRVL